MSSPVKGSGVATPADDGPLRYRPCNGVLPARRQSLSFVDSYRQCRVKRKIFGVVMLCSVFWISLYTLSFSCCVVSNPGLEGRNEDLRDQHYVRHQRGHHHQHHHRLSRKTLIEGLPESGPGDDNLRYDEAGSRVPLRRDHEDRAYAADQDGVEMDTNSRHYRKYIEDNEDLNTHDNSQQMDDFSPDTNLLHHSDNNPQPNHRQHGDSGIQSDISRSHNKFNNINSYNKNGINRRSRTERRLRFRTAGLDQSPSRYSNMLRTKQGASKKLPSALIIGVKKGGTRALLEFLRVHPDIRAPGPEPHFFDRNFELGLEWYR